MFASRQEAFEFVSKESIRPVASYCTVGLRVACDPSATAPVRKVSQKHIYCSERGLAWFGRPILYNVQPLVPVLACLVQSEAAICDQIDIRYLVHACMRASSLIFQMNC
jgi:hypothetical protein